MRMATPSVMDIMQISLTVGTQASCKRRLTNTDQLTFISPVYAYTGASPIATGQIVTGPTNNVVAVASAVPTTSSTPIPPKPSTSSNGYNIPAVPTLSHSSPHLPLNHQHRRRLRQSIYLFMLFFLLHLSFRPLVLDIL